MSTATITQTNQSPDLPFQPALFDDARLEIREVLQKVQDTIAPVWPLKDFVAVNPFLGLAGRSFLNARRYLKLFSDGESLMPLSYYRASFDQGRLTNNDIQTALDELSTDGQTAASLLTVADIVALLRPAEAASETTDETTAHSPTESGTAGPGRRFELLSEVYDRSSGTRWTQVFLDETSRFCAAHYDSGQATWTSPWKNLPLYQAWRSAAALNRRVEVLGLHDFRKFVSQLPPTADAAIGMLLRQLNVPETLWEPVLLCTAFSMPGWSAWARYQALMAERNGEASDDFAGLLAIRLSHDAALSSVRSFQMEWGTDSASQPEFTGRKSVAEDDSFAQYVLLRASEVAWRRGLVDQLSADREQRTAQQKFSLADRRKTPSDPDTARPSAQMVFCIDVRSERLRRHLEATSDSIETFGFAGFFGVPIEFVPLDECQGSSQVPALLTPQFRVAEQNDRVGEQARAQALRSRQLIRSVSNTWKAFQTSATGCFSFVETAGVWSGVKLALRSSLQKNSAPRTGSCKSKQHPAAGRPSLDGLVEQGLTIERQAEMAASILRGIGITENFARLVVFCGHGSQTKNNPLQAGLDCGACGGHSGEPNARFAAALLNQPAVRASLQHQGIVIPDDTRFIAALHNTTNDELTFFDAEDLSPSHQSELTELITCATAASEQTRSERLPLFNSADRNDAFRRATDWSETRPEWGLSANAAFVAAPRSLTKSINLNGRTFLHSYDHRSDDGYAVLEQIMTAPMVVAHWINMQYYASTVDNRHFGSGNKTIHNVVGRFGIYSGNGGDLTTGLPWQSIHDGTDYQHEPLRLLAVIAAPRAAIASIIGRHSLLDDLISNDWMHLLAIDDEGFYRYSPTAGWQMVESAATQLV